MTGRAELFRALGALAEPPEPGHAAIGAALGLAGAPEPGDYAEVFLFGAYPYASVYLGAEGMLGGEARDRVAGFWRALGLVPPAEPDHLAALLGLYAALVEAEADAGAEAGAVVGVARDEAAQKALRRESRKALLWEHLLPWVPMYVAKVADLAAPFHAAWARLLGAALADEAAAIGPQQALPLQLRSAPTLPEDGANPRDWVAALLAPVRSGMLVTRPDLRRGATGLGIGARVGERSFMLRSMLEQDAEGTVAWLAREARRSAEQHRTMEPILGPVAAFWRRRAEACEVALVRTGRGAGSTDAAAIGAR